MSPKFKPWLLLGIIFIVGVVTGSALTIGLGPHFMRPPVPREMKGHWMAHLIRDLNLTDDQQAKIQPILTDADSKLQALRHDEVERGAQIFKAADDQIAALLSPEQKAELLRMEAEREKMFSGHMRQNRRPHEGPNDDGGMPPPPSAPSTNAAPPPGP
jgi:Spy/CpxP family protein refolding chaperone